MTYFKINEIFFSDLTLNTHLYYEPFLLTYRPLIIIFKGLYEQHYLLYIYELL